MNATDPTANREVVLTSLLRIFARAAVLLHLKG